MAAYISAIGIPIQIAFCYLLSTDRKKINWQLVGWGIGLQLVFAFLILKTEPGKRLFEFLNGVVITLLGFSAAGAEMVFGGLMAYNAPVNITDPSVAPEFAEGIASLGLTAQLGFVFAFHVLPTIIFFSAFMAILYQLGIMQRVVYYVAVVMQKTMKTSGAESLSAAANIFVGQTEAPLVIKPYVDKMTMSELNCIMSGGMATIAGGVMAGYVGMMQSSFPDIAGHLIAASVMSAPAALVFAKILVPETEVPETGGKIEMEIKKIDQNVIDAAARGCSEGLTLAMNVAAMLIGFVGLVALFNGVWGAFADAVGHHYSDTFIGYIGQYNSLEALFGLFLSPFAFLLGIPQEDLMIAGELLGKKTILNEFVAYADLATIINGERVIDGTVVEITERSRIVLSYALCGFANLGSIGILIGGIGGIAPKRRGDLAKLGIKALIAGTFASFLTANIAGMMIG